jgi:predicted protein tyrosine phosphatase
MNVLKSTRNQLANARNAFQGPAKKVLCVCSAGLLRSPTLAAVLNRELGFNTRAVGSCAAFALIPLSEALLVWADEVVFVDDASWDELSEDEKEMVRTFAKSMMVLNIPDDFDYGNETLAKVCLEQYNDYAGL